MQEVERELEEMLSGRKEKLLDNLDNIGFNENVISLSDCLELAEKEKTRTKRR